MSNVIPFSFNEKTIQVIDKEGEPWFVAKEVCEVLGYKNPSNILSHHLDEDEKGVYRIYTLGGGQNVSIVNESGLYALALKCTKPEAKQFRKWVTSEVLPSIRKTGSYSTPESVDVKPFLDANQLFKSNLIVARELFKGNQAILSANMATRMATSVDVLDNMGATHLIANQRDNLVTATDIGQEIGLSARKVNLMLEDKGLLTSYRDGKNRKQYEMTEEGEKLGETLDTGKRHSDGTPIKQIKWFRRIVDLLKSEDAA